ncbi:MAG TPA: hypothetical protein PKB14_11970 [Rubrivivax sp.]|nr:hypothetical protein [Rubrivivax sp.]
MTTVSDAATTSWKITKEARRREIEGYASAASVNRGESVSVYVSTKSSKYDAQVYRVGWYGGKGGLFKQDLKNLTGTNQSFKTVYDRTTTMTRCVWDVSFTLNTEGWETGIYLIKLTEQDAGFQQYAYFIVRDDSLTTDITFVSSTMTMHAYNNWGGKSLYASSSSERIPALAISYDRPYARTYNSAGAGQFFAWEIKAVRFLERFGYKVRYIADRDLHHQVVTQSKLVVIAGHCEYWTSVMRKNFVATLEGGVNSLIMGANTCYWQVRFEGDGRTMVAYKERSANDPVRDENSITCQFKTLGLPEETIVGSRYAGVVGNSLPYSMKVDTKTAPAWMLDCIPYDSSSRYIELPAHLGYEVDHMTNRSPKTAVAWATSTATTTGGAPVTSHATWCTYPAQMGSSAYTVVNTGTMNWNFGLDATGFAPFGDVTNDITGAITLNILRYLLRTE